MRSAVSGSSADTLSPASDQMLTTRSLWAAVGIHGGVHVTLLIFAVQPRASTTISLGNGPSLWLLAGLAWTLVAAALMIRLTRRTGSVASQRQPR